VNAPSNADRDLAGTTPTPRGVTTRRHPPTVFRVTNPGGWPVGDFREYLGRLMRKKNIPTVAVLARLSGINDTQLSNWRNGIAQPNPTSLQRLAEFFDVPLGEMLVMAGYADRADLGVPTPSTFGQLIEAYAKADAAQRRRVDDTLRMLTEWLASTTPTAQQQPDRRRRRAN